MLPIPCSILAIEDENDREFMEHIFVSYQRLMYHEIYKITKDPWQTEDILQSTIIKLINKLDTLRTLSPTKRINYIISASKNSAYTQIHKNNRHPETPFDDWFEACDATSIESNPEAFILHQDQLNSLATVWDDLDSRSQYLLSGRYVLNKSYVEMADELEIKTDSVRMAVTRAKRNAYNLLKNKGVVY